VTVTSPEVRYRVDLGRWDRWRWHIPWEALPFVIPLLLIGVLAAAGARIAYAATYQPLTFDAGGAFGPVTGLTPMTDGFATTRWLVTAKPGATATFAYTLTNSGSDPVTIYDQYADGAIQARRSGRMEGLAIAFILIGVGSLAALAIWLWEHPEVHA